MLTIIKVRKNWLETNLIAIDNRIQLQNRPNKTADKSAHLMNYYFGEIIIYLYNWKPTEVYVFGKYTRQVFS